MARKSKQPVQALESAETYGRANDGFVDPFNDVRLLKYFRAVSNAHAYVRFLEFPHLKDRANALLRDLYVLPKLSKQHIRPDMPVSQWPHTESVLSALQENPAIVLLGDPGTGKSTLVSWIAWVLTQVEESTYTEKLGRLVPFPIILRELSIGKDITWDSLLDAFLNQPIAEALDSREHVQALMERGQVVYLIDGVDEIGSVEARQNLSGALHIGEFQYPKCRWLITSRVVGYNEVPIATGGIFTPSAIEGIKRLFSTHGKRLAERGEGLAENTMNWKTRGRENTEVELVERLSRVKWSELLEITTRQLQLPDLGITEQMPDPWAAERYLAPFNDNQISRFAKNWYAQHEEREREREERTTDLIAAVQRDRDTLYLARIPNLLTLMALIHRIEVELPRGKALLYAKIVEAYLVSIDRARKLQTVTYTPDEKKRWLSWIGYHAQLQRKDDPDGSARETLLPRAKVGELLCEAMAKDGIDDPEEAHIFLEYVSRRSGLLIPRGPGEYAFVHLSFQEYFAASHLAKHVMSPFWMSNAQKEPKKGKPPTLEGVRDLADKTSWRETMIFLFEILGTQPEWSDALLNCIYGEDFELVFTRFYPGEVPDMHSTGTPAVQLLAQLAVNPHARFSAELKAKAIYACWESELRQQAKAGRFGSPTIAKGLLACEPDDKEQVWGAFRKAFPTSNSTRLSLGGCTGVTDLEALAGLDNLQELSLFGCTGVTDLGPLGGLKTLEFLDLGRCTGVSEFGALSGSVNLKVLNLFGCTGVTELGALARLGNLKSLNLAGCTALTELGPLARLGNLWELLLIGTGVSELGALAGLGNLKRLSLRGCTGVTELGALAGLNNLESLVLGGCTGVTELGALAGLGNLRTLDLSGCTRLTELEALAELNNLKVLDLSSCTGLSELEALAGLKNLKVLDLRGCTGVSAVPAALRTRKSLQIHIDIWMAF